LTATVGSVAEPPLAVGAGWMILPAPAHGDGTATITVTDPLSGGSSVMTNVLTYGAAASDNIFLLSSVNPTTPVGTQAPNPMSVRVLAADGVTPVFGATIGWSASNSLQLSACGGTSSCTVTSDLNGEAATWLMPAATGIANITATLAPGVYGSSKSVSAQLYATESASDIGVFTPYLWIAQGATVSIPLSARVLSNGVPQTGATVNFRIAHGSGALSAASAQTGSNGTATVTLTVTQIAALVQVSACVAPADAPCQAIFANPVPLPQQNLQPVAGAGQVSTGQAFQPIMVRVTDSSSPPNPVIAASVAFLNTVLRPGGTAPTGGGGETNPTNPAMPVILQVSQSSATTDLNGLTSLLPSAGGFSPPLEVDVGATAGTTSSLDFPLAVLPSAGTGPAVTRPPSIGRPPAPPPRPVRIESLRDCTYINVMHVGRYN
jgi:hypothetical protein